MEKYSYAKAKERAIRVYRTTNLIDRTHFRIALKGFFDWLWLTTGKEPDLHAVLAMLNCRWRSDIGVVRNTLKEWCPKPSLMDEEICWCKFYESCPACFGKK